MIKNIAVALVSYNGDFDKEIIFRVTELNKIEQLKEFIKNCEKLDKKQNINSKYRIEIFST